MTHTFRITFRDEATGMFIARDGEQAKAALDRITNPLSAAPIRFIELMRSGYTERHFINLADVSVVSYSAEEDPS